MDTDSVFGLPPLPTLGVSAGLRLHTYLALNTGFPEELVNAAKTILEIPEDAPFSADMELIPDAGETHALPRPNEIWVLLQAESIDGESKDHSDWITALFQHPHVIHLPLFRYGPTTVLYRVCLH